MKRYIQPTIETFKVGIQQIMEESLPEVPVIDDPLARRQTAFFEEEEEDYEEIPLFTVKHKSLWE